MRLFTMIILVDGASHTGKTLLAQKLLEKYKYPYLSIDHLKMGLIRSGQTHLSPLQDAKLVDYLWPIVREMIKTAIENEQNLIIEGCYIPGNWKDHFFEDYLKSIKYYCLIMSENFIQNHFDDIIGHANAIEERLYDSDLTKDILIQENKKYLERCKSFGNDFIIIDKDYEQDLANRFGF